MADPKIEETKWQEPQETEAAFLKIKALLKENKIDFKVTDHKAVNTCEEAAETRGVSLESGAKAMLLKDSGKKLSREGVEYYLAIMSASTRFSSKQFKKTINCKNFRFASPEEVHAVTGCLPGAVSPFGKMFNVPVWVDRSLSKQENINFNCGMRTKSIFMKYDDYFKIEGPTFQVFTEEEIALGDIPKEEEEKKVDTRDAKKAERLASRQAKTEQDADVKWDPKDPCASQYGERELMRSQGNPEDRFTKVFTTVDCINADIKGKTITVRGRLHNTRGKGGLAFAVIRQKYSTI
jgi:Ala-tRNA(Pro) deacylase